MRRKPIPKQKRLAVWEKYGRRCAYCGDTLSYRDMQVDHLESVYVTSMHNGWVETQNDDMSNLMPSCRMCNYYKSTRTLEQFRDALSDMLMRNVRRPFDYRLALKYGMVQENVHPVRFYYEKFEDDKKKGENDGNDFISTDQ